MTELLTERLRPAVHPTYPRLICAYLRQAGFDNDTILQDTRLQWAQLLDEHRFVSIEQLVRLIRRAVELTGKPWVGLEIGKSVSVSAHGSLGYAAVSARDLREVLKTVSRFIVLRLQVVDVTFEEVGDQCLLRIRETIDLGEAREFLHDALLATYFQLVDTITSQKFRHVRVDLPFERPAWAGEYEAVLECPVVFNAPELCLSFSAELLDTPCLTADVGIFRSALRDCENQLKQLDAGGIISQKVSNQFLNSSGNYPTLDEVAQNLAMSKRTLIRKLKAEGTSFQELLDGMRQELAAWYLLETKLPVEQIAERLGYQDTSNFSRTFRRWFAMSPVEMRRLENSKGAS
ncbi:MAG: AraC family transcriptional regulator [Alcanivoracaceae bacterium]|nr:AraC family transcriptional regulator [Alcanivoracaceae bacterium]